MLCWGGRQREREKEAHVDKFQLFAHSEKQPCLLLPQLVYFLRPLNRQERISAMQRGRDQKKKKISSSSTGYVRVRTAIHPVS